MTFFPLPSSSIVFSYLPVASASSCIYTVPISIERVLKLVLFVQYRLLYLLECMKLPLWKNLSVIVDLVTIRPSSLNIFKIMCCISLDSKLRFDLCNLHLLPDKSRDVLCDLLWPFDKSHDVSCDRSRCPTPDAHLFSLNHQHDYWIRTPS